MVFLHVEPPEAESLFQEGKIDWLGQPFWNKVFLSFTTEKVEKYVLSETSTMLCLLNTQQFPFNHLKFRQALSLAVDRSSFSKIISPLAESAYSPLSPHLSSFSSSTPKFDASEACDTLYAWLEEMRMTIDHLPLLTIYFAPKTMGQITASFLSQCWRNHLGISCNIEGVNWNTLYQKYKKGDFQLGLMRWVPRFNDPMYFLNALRYYSTASNIFNWKSFRYQHVLDRAEKALDIEERKKWIKEAEFILQKEVPTIPLFHISYSGLKRKGVDPSFQSRCGFHMDSIN